MQYEWLDNVPAIHKSFFIEDFNAQSAAYSIEKMVFVQCECLPEQAFDEIHFVEEQALKDDRIKGIVAYAPMEKGKAIVPILELYNSNPLVKGVRRMYDDNPSVCTTEGFIDAVRLLPDFNLSMDLSIKPASVTHTLEMIRSCPDTQFVLDHLGKPDIKHHSFDEFKMNMDAFAKLPNVVAKISGLITEADWESWKADEIAEYISFAMDRFGAERLMFGGDWPVVLLAGSHQQWIDTVFSSLERYTDEQLHKVFYTTANRIYRL